MLKNAVKKHGWKWLFGGLMIGLLINLAIMPLNLFAAEEEQSEFLLDYGDYDDIEDLVIDYHKALNEYLNERIENFVKASPEELRAMEKVPLKEVDQGDGTKVDKPDAEGCAKIEKPTSAYCISQKFLKEYFRFREQMLKLRNESTAFEKAQEGVAELKKEQKKSFFELQLKYTEITDDLRKMDQMIDEELGYAERTMELALATYNELHMAYPIHQKLKDFIFELENFRDALADIRDEVEFLPFTFFNVQTSACT